VVVTQPLCHFDYCVETVGVSDGAQIGGDELSLKPEFLFSCFFVERRFQRLGIDSGSHYVDLVGVYSVSIYKRVLDAIGDHYELAGASVEEADHCADAFVGNRT